MAVPRVKDFETTLKRVENYISPKNYTDVNLHGRIYEDVIPLDVIQHYGPADRITFNDLENKIFDDVKIGDVFRPLWSIHWFKLNITLPSKWIGKEVRLRWNSGSEVMIWKNGIPVQGLSGVPKVYIRTDYIISKCLSETELTQTIFLEMELTGLKGDGCGEQINPPDFNKTFKINMAEITVFNRDIYNLVQDLEIIIGMAKHLPRQNQRAYQALFTANHAVNICSDRKEDSVKTKGRRFGTIKTFNPAANVCTCPKSGI